MNPDCSEIRPLHKCNTTTQERKNDFFESYRAEKRKKLNRVTISAVKVERKINTLAPDESKGLYRVWLEDEVDCIAVGDYALEESAIDINLL